MLSSPAKPALYCVAGGVLSLSGPGLQEFLKAVLAKGVPFRFRARGSSMHPFIQDLDIVTISCLHRREPRLGEVVAFCHPATQRLVIHRVIARQSQGYLIRGDNISEADGVVPGENLLGVVSRLERGGRRVRFGLGWERCLIALLARYDLLGALTSLGKIVRPIFKRLPI